MGHYVIQRADAATEHRLADTAREAVKESNEDAKHWELRRGRPYGPLLSVRELVAVPAADWAE